MFLSAAVLKIPTGGYVPIIIATVSFIIMFVWRSGKLELRNRAKLNQVNENSIYIIFLPNQIPWEDLESMIKTNEIKRCKGTAVFMASVAGKI